MRIKKHSWMCWKKKMWGAGGITDMSALCCWETQLAFLWCCTREIAAGLMIYGHIGCHFWINQSPENPTPCWRERTPQSNIHYCRLSSNPGCHELLNFGLMQEKPVSCVTWHRLIARSFEILTPSPDPDPGGCVWNWKGQGSWASAEGIKQSQAHCATYRNTRFL